MPPPSATKCCTDVQSHPPIPILQGKPRLDAFLAASLPDTVSRSRVVRSVQEGMVLVNGRPQRKAAAAVKPGDIVTCTLVAPPPLEVGGAFAWRRGGQRLSSSRLVWIHEQHLRRKFYKALHVAPCAAPCTARYVVLRRLLPFAVCPLATTRHNVTCI